MRACSRCGAHNVKTKRGRSVCTSCRTSSDERKRRRCTECGHRRKIPDEIRPLGRVCFPCQRAKARARTRAYYQAHREEYAARHAAWRRANPQTKAAIDARYWAKLRSDPKRRISKLQDKRIWEHIKEERNGRQIENRTRAIASYEPPKTGNHVAPMLPAEPLLHWLRREYRNWSIAELARYVGVNESSLQRIWNGDYKHVSLHVADQIFTGANCPHLLALYYPEP